MQNRVRVRSDQNIVTNAIVELWDGERWVDVSNAVSAITPTLRAGEVSRVKLDLILVDLDLEAARLDDETLAAFAAALHLHGWSVAAPVAEAA